jgi:hypothetical protein
MPARQPAGSRQWLLLPRQLQLQLQAQPRCSLFN